jgi:Na+-translocating ferredoxin:NAD+ oxidoreductase subunit E
VRVPSASASLGIYAPLVAVNCLVLGGVGGPSPRALLASVVGSLGRGARFALALLLIALVRELLGAGTITLFPVAAFGGTVAVGGLVDEPVRALGLAGGALLCLGYLAGAVRAVTARAVTARAAGKAAGGESSR